MDVVFELTIQGLSVAHTDTKSQVQKKDFEPR
jgi:hypothetical protein